MCSSRCGMCSSRCGYLCYSDTFLYTTTEKLFMCCSKFFSYFCQVCNSLKGQIGPGSAIIDFST